MSGKPRLYIVISTFLPLVGGAETQTLAQAQALHQHGYQVKIVTFQHQHAWRRQELINGIPVLRVAGQWLGRRDHLPRMLQRLLYLFAVLQMLWTIWEQRDRFDILQVCQLNLLAFPLALICWLARKPMTVVVISTGAGKASKHKNEPTRLIAGPLDPQSSFLAVPNHTWIDGDIHGIQVVGDWFVKLARLILLRARVVVITLSTQMKRYLEEHQFRIPRTSIISNGVDLSRYQPHKTELDLKKPNLHVVCVSKFRYEKGIDILLQAWKIVHEQVPEAKLILVGGGPLEKQFQEMATALEISNSVEFMGVRRDVPEQIHRGYISILPSRWEGMPNALLEAMASANACIATRVSGSEDLIQNQENGLLVPVEDYQEMANALLILLKNPKLVRQFAHTARETIEQHYTLEHITQQYIKIYELLLNEYGITPPEEISAPEFALRG